MKERFQYLREGTTPSVVDAALEHVGPRGEARSEAGLFDYWRIVSKHALLIGAVCLSIVLLTGVIVFVEAPVYTATATVLIERNAPQVLDIQQIMPESFQDETETGYYKTQYELLKGRTLATAVIKDLALEQSALLRPGNQRFGLISDVVGFVEKPFARFVGASGRQHREDIGADESGLIDNYLKRLEVSPIRGTRLVAIGFSSPDRKLAARIANAHAVAYIRQGLELRSNTNEEAERFLEAKLTELKKRVERSEGALNAYRRDHGVISLSEKEDVVVEKFDELYKDLTAVEAHRISLEAEEKLIEKRQYDSLPAVLGSELIEHLKENAAKIESEYAEAAEEEKPGFPQLDQLRAKLDEVNTRLRREIENVVDGIQSAFQATVTNENKLNAAIEQQKALVLQQNDIGVQYGILAREVDTNRELYSSVLQRMKQTEVAADLRASNIFMVDKAQPPGRPSRPKRLEDLLISAMLGLAVGIGVAFLKESLDDTLKSTQDVERYLHLPKLASLPDLAGTRTLELAQLNSKLPQRLLAKLKGDSSKFLVAWCAESYRTLRNSLMFSRAGGPPRVVLITSALNSEGKTVIAVNTAACFARTGIKVLLIDADLRRPRCHKMLEIDNEVGLSEVLAGHVQPEKAIVMTQVSGLSVLLAGAIPPDPAELLASIKMLETLAQLRSTYDFIIIDSAPAMLVSEVIPLSTMVDGALMVVSSTKTSRDVVMEACSRLHSVGAKIFGVVLNRVNVCNPEFLYANRYFWHYEHTYHNASDEVLRREAILHAMVPYISQAESAKVSSPTGS